MAKSDPQTLTGLVPWPLAWATALVTNHSLREEPSPGVQSELPSMQLHSISSYPVAGHQREISTSSSSASP